MALMNEYYIRGNKICHEQLMSGTENDVQKYSITDQVKTLCSEKHLLWPSLDLSDLGVRVFPAGHNRPVLQKGVTTSHHTER